MMKTNTKKLPYEEPRYELVQMMLSESYAKNIVSGMGVGSEDEEDDLPI